MKYTAGIDPETDEALIGVVDEHILFARGPDKKRICDLINQANDADNLKAQNKKLVEWVKEQIHLHTCEQEGISSGMPSPEQWYKSYYKGEKLLDELLTPDTTTEGE